MADHAARIIAALNIPQADYIRLDSGIVAVDPKWESGITTLLSSDNKYKSYKWWWNKNYRATKSFLDSTTPVWILHKGTGGALLKPTAHIGAIEADIAVPSPSQAAWNGSYNHVAQKGVVSVYGVVPMDASGNGVAVVVPVLSNVTKLFGNVVGATRQLPSKSGSEVGVSVFGSSATTAYCFYAFGPSQMTTTIPVPSNTNIDWRLLTGPIALTWGEVSQWFTLIGCLNSETLNSMMSGQMVSDYVWRDKSAGAVNSMAERPNDAVIYVSRKASADANPYLLIPEAKSKAAELYKSDETVDGVSLDLVRRNYQASTEFVAAVAAEFNFNEAIKQYGGIDYIVYTDGVVSQSCVDLKGDIVKSLVTVETAVSMIEYNRPLGTVITVGAAKTPSVEGNALSGELGVARVYGALVNAYARASQRVQGENRLTTKGDSGAFGLAIIADCAGKVDFKQRTAINMLVRPEVMTDMRVLNEMSKL